MKCTAPDLVKLVNESHPSRGAWIEMSSTGLRRPTSKVAPLTGCVD